MVCKDYNFYYTRIYSFSKNVIHLHLQNLMLCMLHMKSFVFQGVFLKFSLASCYTSQRGVIWLLFSRAFFTFTQVSFKVALSANNGVLRITKIGLNVWTYLLIDLVYFVYMFLKNSKRKLETKF